jgi:hypothetical protein
MWRKVVISSDFHAGCPVLAVAVEDLTDGNAAPRLAAAAAFDNWTTLLTESLRENGIKTPDARRIATLIVAAVEGTVAICRAQRSIEPLDQVTAELTRLVKDALQ